MPTTRHRAFSLIELLVVIAIIALLIGILIPVLGTVRAQARRTQDSTQIRGIIQAMQIWAGQNDDSYPLPSRVDISHTTIADPGQGLDYVKDNTGNIFSLMIYNELILPEQFISPVEENPQVREDKDYAFASPELADSPEFALWDPGFAGMVGEDAGKTGVPATGRRSGVQSNNSYAHHMPFGARLQQWKGTAGANQGMVANRSTIWSTDTDASGERIWRFEEPSDRGSNGGDSNTLFFYSPTKTWNGHIGYNDTSVDFSERPDPGGSSVLYDDAGTERAANDNVFVNEANDGTASGGMAGMDHPERRPGRGSNIYLRAYRNVEPEVGDPIRSNAIVEPWDLHNVTEAQGD